VTAFRNVSGFEQGGFMDNRNQENLERQLDQADEWTEADFPENDVRSRIARRAYQIYEERGGEHGYDLNDWLQAEDEVRPGPRRAENAPSQPIPEEEAAKRRTEEQAAQSGGTRRLLRAS
jgi:hypothetical protein